MEIFLDMFAANPCLKYPCDNGGSCEFNPNNDNGYQCKCKPPYSGPNCRNRKNIIKLKFMLIILSLNKMIILSKSNLVSCFMELPPNIHQIEIK